MLSDSSSPESLAAASIRDEISDNRLQFVFFCAQCFSLPFGIPPYSFVPFPTPLFLFLSAVYFIPEKMLHNQNTLKCHSYNWHQVSFLTLTVNDFGALMRKTPCW